MTVDVSDAPVFCATEPPPELAAVQLKVNGDPGSRVTAVVPEAGFPFKVPDALNPT